MPPLDPLYSKLRRVEDTLQRTREVNSNLYDRVQELQSRIFALQREIHWLRSEAVSEAASIIHSRNGR